MKNVISNILAVLWFFGVLLGAILFIFLALIMIFFTDIVGMLKSGFSVPAIGFSFVMLAGIIFGITGLVPAFRKCYYKLPWLYPLCVIMTMDLAILAIAEAILSIGFSLINTPRHVITVILMVAQIIVCRAAMCIYLKRNSMVLHKYDRVE